MADEGSQSVGAGGFIRALPSPAPSSTSTATSATVGLPHPRGKPLLPGSPKEDKVRTYVEEQLLHISRRYVKHFAIENPDDKVVGYHSIGELCKDVEGLVNILWLSATPSLQIPYLLNIAGNFTEWLTHFPPQPKATFSLLSKLDHCFASLLLGRDMDTQEPLPGFEDAAASMGMTATDKVRCKSIAEETRRLVLDVMSNDEARVEEANEDGEAGYDTPVGSESEDPASGRGGYGVEDDDDDHLHMAMARVYENTMVQLGEAL